MRTESSAGRSAGVVDADEQVVLGLAGRRTSRRARRSARPAAAARTCGRRRSAPRRWPAGRRSTRTRPRCARRWPQVRRRRPVPVALAASPARTRWLLTGRSCSAASPGSRPAAHRAAARESAAASGVPRPTSSTSARLRKRWASSSQVKPMPPWTWTQAWSPGRRPGRPRCGRRDGPWAPCAGRGRPHGVVDLDAGGLHGGPGHLDADLGVGQQVLDRLERADGLAELRALLGVGGGRAPPRPRPGRPGGRPPAGRRVRSAVGELGAARRRCPAGSSSTTSTGVSGSSGRSTGRDAGRRVDQGHAVVVHDQQGVERGEVLDEPGRRRAPAPRRPRRPRPAAAVGDAPSTSPAARNVPMHGPGTAARPSSSNTIVASARPRPDAAVGLGQGQGEHAHVARARARGPGRPRRAGR